MARWATILGVATSLALAARATAQDEWGGRKFLEGAIQENNFEMQLGLLAEARGNSAEVRAYGRDLAGGHFLDRLEANRTAARLHMQVPLAGPEDSRDQRHSLSALSSRDFDHAFVRFMAERQAEDLTAFREAAASHGAVADLARESLPLLQRQLETARHLERSLSEPWTSDR